MRWPEIFFKSRKNVLLPARELASKTKIPSISELEKSVGPSPAQAAADKAAAESLRALREKDSMRIGPPAEKETGVPAPTAPADAPANAAPAASASVTKAETAPDAPQGGSVPVRRKAKLTDFARVLLPKSEETLPKADLPETRPLPVPPEPTPAAVFPASFPVAGTAGAVMEPKSETALETDSPEPGVSSGKNEESSAAHNDEKTKHDVPVTINQSLPSGHESESSLKDTTRVTLPEPMVTPPPKVRPSPSSSTFEPVTDSREKREFILANGERILGHILSENADTIYLEHPTLGVLTLPRRQIAGKPIEVILINGDRVVGDLIAETPECLYIRHASLGMLTVPHNQRSTRVVEAILKDGDRILGEVLAETDHFTVIRSATLGTVAVQHEQVAMLNRKIEQTQLRALPSPALGDVNPDAPSPS